MGNETSAWIVAVLSGVVAAVVTMWNLYINSRKQLRVDAIAEYKDIVERLDQRNNELHQEVIGLYKSHAECLKENAELNAKITVLDARVVMLEATVKPREDANRGRAMEPADGKGQAPP